MDGSFFTSSWRLCGAHVIGVSITVIMSWVLWKSLVSVLLYIDVSVRSSSEPLFFFGHLLSRFIHLEAPVIRRGPSTVVSRLVYRPEPGLGTPRSFGP